MSRFVQEEVFQLWLNWLEDDVTKVFEHFFSGRKSEFRIRSKGFDELFQRSTESELIKDLKQEEQIKHYLESAVE